MEAANIFVSAVSSELRTFRRAARDALRCIGVTPVVQEDFPTDYRELRQVLTSAIKLR